MMRYILFCVTLCISFAGLPALAQPIIQYDKIPEPWIEIIGDVNADGADDRLRSTPLNEYTDIISIELGQKLGVNNYLPQNSGFPDYIVAINANWSDFEGLERTSDTTFTIHTGCFACGNYHGHISHHIAYRNQTFVVAGYTYSYADRRYAVVGMCDVNLQTGNAAISFEDYDVQNVTTNERAFPLEQLPQGYRPEICSLLDKYDNDYIETYINETRPQ